ncbi:MAG: hypothetical protein A4E71_02947 [Smithella sp. PtaU1.Bin162]|nr:MAG: hypothetical protein A4E71_02947 [Smithella sp. PtaU1.Bin162]
MKKRISCIVTVLFLFSFPFPVNVFGQTGVHVMTLGDGTKVFMTKDQLAALAKQPGVKITSTLETIASEEMAIPIPSEPGGYIVADPESLAAALNSTQITTGATASSVAAATSAGSSAIQIGAYAAGLAAKGGFTVGTTTLIVIGGAALIGGAIAIGSSGGGSTPAHH